MTKNLDSFGIPITLSYEGKNSFVSHFGALVSVLSKIGILAYLAIVITQVYYRDATTITTFEYFRDYFLEAPEFIINRENFDIAVRLTYGGPNLTVANELERYYTPRFYHVDVGFVFDDSNPLDKASGFYFHQAEIEKIKCPENRFGDETVGKGTNFSDYWCPEDIKNLTIKGTVASSSKKMFYAAVEPCNQQELSLFFPGKTCASQEEILEHMPYLYTWVEVRSQYFDVNEFEMNPIKYTFKKWILRVPREQAQLSMFLLSQNKAIMQDNIISSSLGTSQETLFYQVASDYTYFQNFDIQNVITNAFFLQDEEVKIRKRSVFTLIDAFSQVGGVTGLVTLICTFITRPFQRGLFFNNIAKSFFFQQNSNVEQQTSDPAFQIFARREVRFKLLDQILMICRGKQHPRKLLYNKTKQMLSNELDVQTYLLTLRKVNFLVDMLFNKKQKSLMKTLIKQQVSIHETVNHTPTTSLMSLNKKPTLESIKRSIDECQKKTTNKISKRIIESLFKKKDSIQSPSVTSFAIGQHVVDPKSGNQDIISPNIPPQLQNTLGLGMNKKSTQLVDAVKEPQGFGPAIKDQKKKKTKKPINKNEKRDQRKKNSVSVLEQSQRELKLNDDAEQINEFE